MGNLGPFFRKAWRFLWDDDSIWSWLMNILVAFLLIRFLVYPLLGLVLGTSYPIVAVVSESMEHSPHDGILCGQYFPEFQDSLNNYWDVCGPWYEKKNIRLPDFQDFRFPNGFDKGDVIILWKASHLKIGDILIFQGARTQPIIHRIVKISEDNSVTYYQTKGDHNSDSITGPQGELKIDASRIYGKGVLRIPYLGWVKILFVEALQPLGIIIER